MRSKKHKNSGSIAVGILIVVVLIIGIVVLAVKQPDSNKNKVKSTRNTTYPAQKPEAHLLNSQNQFFDETSKTWKKPDNNLIKSDEKNYDVVNAANTFKAYFSDEISSKNETVKFQRFDAWVTFKVLDKLVIKNKDDKGNETTTTETTVEKLTSKKGQKIVDENGKANKFEFKKLYENNGASLDAVYTVLDHKLSEEMILSKYIGYPEFTQILKLQNVYAKQEGSLINFYHTKTNELLWFISAPKMYETDNQNVSSSDISYDLKCSDDQTEIEKCDEIILTKIIGDKGKEWLSDPKRQYPVAIDPNFQIDSADVATNWISSDPTYVVVSQETTIKTEGTGSVKVVVTPTSCWSSNGSACNCTARNLETHNVYDDCSTSACSCWGDASSCISGCSYTSVNSYTAYPGCTSIACSGSNCWGYGVDGACQGGCNSQTGQFITAYDTCTASPCGYGKYDYSVSSLNPNAYDRNESGCQGGGGGSCTDPYEGATLWTAGAVCGGTGCTPFANQQGAYVCEWIPAGSYRYETNGTGFSYVEGAGGPCSDSGLNNCFRYTGGTTYGYTSGNSCGAGGCSGGGWKYTSSTSCTFHNNYTSATAYNPVTRYRGNTSCSSDGSADCYELYNGDSYATGGASCSSGGNCGYGTYYNYRDCDWIQRPVNATITVTKSPLNLSQNNRISFWVRSDRVGTFLRFEMGETNSNEQAFDFAINTANTWEKKVWDLTGISAASIDAITKLAYRITANGSSQFTFYFDDIQSYNSLNTPSVCVISETSNDSSITPQWVDNTSYETGYELYKSTNGGAFSLLTGTTLPANSTSYNDTSISQGNTYTYQLRAVTNSNPPVYSEYCTFPTLSIQNGNIRFEQTQLDGVRIN